MGIMDELSEARTHRAERQRPYGVFRLLVEDDCIAEAVAVAEAPVEKALK